MDIVKNVIDLLNENKARDLVNIDIKDKSDLFSSMIIATSISARHVHALADKVADLLKSNDFVYIMDGSNSSEWIIMEVEDVLIHIFTEEKRLEYNIEKLWEVTNKEE